MRDARDDAQAIASDMWATGDDHGVVGGNLQRVVDSAFIAHALNAGHISSDCESLAAECDRRAEICEHYAEQMAVWTDRHRAWSSDHALWRISRFEPDFEVRYPGAEPRQPEKPAAWVEIG